MIYNMNFMKNLVSWICCPRVCFKQVRSLSFDSFRFFAVKLFNKKRGNLLKFLGNIMSQRLNSCHEGFCFPGSVQNCLILEAVFVSVWKNRLSRKTCFYSFSYEMDWSGLNSSETFFQIKLINYSKISPVLQSNEVFSFFSVTSRFPKRKWMEWWLDWW